jgi:hypothetical protein
VTAGSGPVRIALDENFPTPILDALDRYIVEAELVPVDRIDSRLRGLPDRQLVLALHQLGWPILVTANYKMAHNPKEIAALLKTKMTLVALEAAGHDMVRATGALLLYLPGVLRSWEPAAAEVFSVRPRQLRAKGTWEVLRSAAERLDRNVAELYAEVQVTDDELAAVVLPKE